MIKFCRIDNWDSGGPGAGVVWSGDGIDITGFDVWIVAIGMGFVNVSRPIANPDVNVNIGLANGFASEESGDVADNGGMAVKIVRRLTRRSIFVSVASTSVSVWFASRLFIKLSGFIDSIDNCVGVNVAARFAGNDASRFCAKRDSPLDKISPPWLSKFIWFPPMIIPDERGFGGSDCDCDNTVC